jgi:hypothetical protein
MDGKSVLFRDMVDIQTRGRATDAQYHLQLFGEVVVALNAETGHWRR